MYDEIVKRLRELQSITEHCAEQSCDECENKELCDKYDNKTLSGTYKEAADAIEELQAQIDGWIDQERNALLKSISHWIPVTERLPNERGNYLVVINCPRGRWDEICAFDWEEEWVSIDEYAEAATKWVTHWMPLPEPPKDD